jgi:hypothetical protein
MVVGKAGAFGDLDAGLAEGCEEFFRVPDPGKRQDLAAAKRDENVAVGARSGPAGMTRPLPMPRRPSTSRIARSLASDGF